MESPLRARRQECGLTQAELAARAGVSRQLVAAVEAGQNAPGVEAALRLAGALASTVEALFGGGSTGTAPLAAALGGELPEGALLRVGQVGGRLVGAELADHGIAGAGWASPDGVVQDGRLRLFDGVGGTAALSGLVLAGCDPALGVAEAMLRGRGARSLLAISAPTGRALAALAAGTLHAAVVHGPPGGLPPAPVPVLRLHLARWQVGVGVAASLRRRSLEDLLEGDIPVVGRDPAAASQQAFDRAVARLGATARPRAPARRTGAPTRRTGAPARPAPAPALRAGGHIDAARTAATVRGAGITNEAAARAFDLDFLALEGHTVEIWLDRRWLEHPGVAALGELLATAAFTDRVTRFGGYDLSDCGAVVAA